MNLGVNRTAAIGAHERQLFIELLARVVSPQIYIRCQRLIARKVAADFSFLAVNRNFYEACISNDVSRVSLSCLFCASFWCDCGVVRYHKSWRATIFSPKKIQKLSQDAHKSLFVTPHNQQTLLIAMPPTFAQHIPIDSEWAEALVGLRLNVPNSWWPGFVDDGLNRGRIAAVNLDAPNAFYFEVELGNKLGAHYAMRYDSVLLYADEGQPGFSRFRSRCCVRVIRTTKW
jgi:hypothetical protein